MNRFTLLGVFALVFLGLCGPAIAEDPCAAKQEARAAAHQHSKEVQRELVTTKSNDPRKATLLSELQPAKDAAAAAEQAYRQCSAAERERQRVDGEQEHAAAVLVRQDEATRRSEEAKAKRAMEEEHRAELNRRATDRTWMQVPLSAQICDAQEQRKLALEGIAEDKKYAQLGGVLNLRAVYANQELVRHSDGRLESARATLAGMKLKALGCKDKLVLATRGCREGDQEQCSGDKIRDFADLFGYLR